MSSSSSNGSGITFGNYEVVAKDDGTPVLLGGGSYGKTYRAVHSFLGSTVALKVIHDSFAFDAGVKKRFLTEAKAMARLRHPHVAQILNCGEEEGTLYYAVEYCDGGDLEHVVRKIGPLKPGTVLALARQAAEALAYVHDNNFLHRDLKPSNLMLATPAEGGDARLKVIDFGLVKQFDQNLTSVMTQTGQFLGTMLFASPEQLREEHLDARSDIFSLGLTLWFMLKGGTPFPGKPAQVVAQRLSAKAYTADLPPHLPPPLHSLLARMVSLNVEARPASMREVLQAIDDCAHQMVQAESPMAQLANTGDATDAPPEPDEDAFSGMSIHLTSVERMTGDCYALDSEQMEVDFGVRHRGRRLPSGKVVALTLIRRSLAASPAFVQHLEQTVLHASQCAGPQLIRPYELVKFRDHLVLVEEWVQGLDLLTLLRQRKTISLAEALPIARQLADACDLARNAQLAKLEIAAHRVILQFDKLPWTQLDTAAQTQLLSQPLQQWPPFTVRIAPTYTIEEKVTGPSTMSQMPQLTVVGDTEQDADLASRYGRLIYRIVSGHPALATATVSRSAYVNVTGLTEESNQFLSQVIAGEAHYADCVSILEDLWRHERLPPAAFRSSGTGTTRPWSTRGTNPPIAKPRAGQPPGSAALGGVSTVSVPPIEPALAAATPAWDLNDAKPVDPTRPRIIPLGKKPQPPLSTPVQPKPVIAARTPPAALPKVAPKGHTDPAATPVAQPKSAGSAALPPAPAAAARTFPISAVALSGVGLLVVVVGLFLWNRPVVQEESDNYADEVETPAKRPQDDKPLLEKSRPVVAETTPPQVPPAKPATVIEPTPVPLVPPVPAPQPSALVSTPVPAPQAMPTPVAAKTMEPTPPAAVTSKPKPEEPKMAVAPVVTAPPPPVPVPIPPPVRVDPIAEQQKRYDASHSVADAQQLSSLLETKLTDNATSPAEREDIAKRLASLLRVTKEKDPLLDWKLYQHYQKNGLKVEATQALTAACDKNIKEAWVEIIRILPDGDQRKHEAQQHIAEAWSADPLGKAAIHWLQQNVEATIPANASARQVKDPMQPGQTLTIPAEQWKEGGVVALPAAKRYFHLPPTLPKPMLELVQTADGRIIPGAIKVPGSNQQLDNKWAAWRAGAKVEIGGETFHMPDLVPPADLEANNADGNAHTVKSPYDGQVVNVAENDWKKGARIQDSVHSHLHFRMPDPLPEWSSIKEASAIEGRYTAVRSPFPGSGDIPVTADAWGEGETVDPVTKQKVKMPRIADPKLTCEVTDADAKTIVNPYTQARESWKGTWEGGASTKWSSSGFTYRLPSALPSTEVLTAKFVSYNTVKSPYADETIAVTETDWSNGIVTPKKGRPMKMPTIRDPNQEVRILDLGGRIVANPYTNKEFAWPGEFIPKQTAKWGPFTMRLPASKSLFKEKMTIPREMRESFKTSNSIYFNWDRDGYWVSEPIPVGGNMAETCQTVTEDAHRNRRIPLDYVFVFDGKNKLISQRVKTVPNGTAQAKR